MSETLNKESCFFGRRKGKSLSSSQAQLLKEFLPKLKLNLDELHNIFPNNKNIKELHLEIGFGGGEYLLHHAKLRPNTGFMGVEPFTSGMVKLLKVLKIEEERAANIRLFDDDAAILLKHLPSDSFTGIDLFYPDPWPKKKHNKRRFINAENLAQIVRVLKHGAYFRFASDIADYVNWTLLHCEQNGQLKWKATNVKDWQNPYSNWISTRYEQKAIREGRAPCYLSFQIEKTPLIS